MLPDTRRRQTSTRDAEPGIISPFGRRVSRAWPKPDCPVRRFAAIQTLEAMAESRKSDLRRLSVGRIVARRMIRARFCVPKPLI